MKKTLTIVISLILFLCLSKITNAQIEDGFPVENYKRNVIKWNLTPFILWSYKNINFSYERVLKPNRSFSVNAGFFELPSTGIYDSLNIQNELNNWGFSASGDYRFYFTNRNPGKAPDGLYWGPYASYHHYQFENTISVINNPEIQGDLILDGKYNIFSAGVEIGYQFIIKERLSIDMVFLGPSFSAYSGTLNLKGDITSEKYDEYLEAIRDILISKSPLLKELVNKGSIDDKGVSTSFGFGFRYLLQIGYRF